MTRAAILSSLVLLGACQGPPADLGGTLCGTVVDAANEAAPIAGATVTAQRAVQGTAWPRVSTTDTDDDGAFCIVLDAGPYSVMAEVQDRFASAAADVVVHRGESTVITLEIPEGAPTLTVRVPTGVVQAGYGKLVTIEAEASGPDLDSTTYEWRQVSGPDVTASFQGQGTPTITFRTPPIEELVDPPRKFGPIAISARTQGEYLIEVEVQDGAQTASGRTAVRSASVSGGWPRLAAGVDGYFHCGDIERPHFVIENQSPCRPDELDCTPVEIEDADTCTPRIRAHYSGSFELTEETSGRTIRYQMGRWFGINDENAACGRPTCHPNEAERWSRTRHATVFQRGIDGQLRSDYEPRCARCHTLGYDASGRNNGFDDASFDSGWRWPTELEPGNFDTIEPNVQGLANVQCSACHAPALFWKGLGVGVCAQCHDAPPDYTKVAEWRASPMSRFVRELEPDDPALRDDCTGCHSVQGFLQVARGKAVPNAPDADSAEPVTCVTCHDVKSSNPSMLRFYAATELPSSQGLVAAGASAVCLRCHNCQVDPRDPNTLAEGLAPMQGAQSDLFYETGAMGVAPSPLPQHASLVDCAYCHMAEAGDPDLAGAVGRHTFLVRAANGRPNEAICQGCHEGADGFDVLAQGDYDGDGVVEPARSEIRGLMAMVRGALAVEIESAKVHDCTQERMSAGVTERDRRLVLIDRLGEPLEDCDGLPIRLPPSDPAVYRAAFDLMLVERDASEGLHAPGYSAEVLQTALVGLRVDRPAWDWAR